MNLRTPLVAMLLGAAALVACQGSSTEPEPTPNVQATIDAAVQATIEALPTNTPVPTAVPEPTDTPPEPLDTPTPTGWRDLGERVDPITDEVTRSIATMAVEHNLEWPFDAPVLSIRCRGSGEHDVYIHWGGAHLAASSQTDTFDSRVRWDSWDPRSGRLERVGWERIHVPRVAGAFRPASSQFGNGLH